MQSWQNLDDALGVGGTVEVDVWNGFCHYKYPCMVADLRDYLDINKIIIKFFSSEVNFKCIVFKSYLGMVV